MTDTPEIDEDENEDEPTLADLSAAYAELVAKQNDEQTGQPRESILASVETSEAIPPVDAPTDVGEADEDELEFAISPAAIVEALLFVGNPENKPLTPKVAAALMRGVSPKEVEQAIVELNDRYENEARPYTILAENGGFRLVIREEMLPLLRRLEGSKRQTKLTQAAVDVLAVIAYSQPISRRKIDDMRGKDSGGILRDLVRRELIIEVKQDSAPRQTFYETTPRFLELFSLDKIQELPQAQDV
jgi:segregation and condensation protein B